MGVLRKMCDAMGGFCVEVPAAAAWLAAAAPHGLAPPGPFFTPAGGPSRRVPCRLAGQRVPK